MIPQSHSGGASGIRDRPTGRLRGRRCCGASRSPGRSSGAGNRQSASGRPPVSSQDRGEQGRGFFCDFQLHGQAADHPPQVGDAVLVAAPLIIALEEALQAFERDALPAGDEFGLQLVLPGGLGRAALAREDFKDDLGLELRRERPAAAFRMGGRSWGARIDYCTGPIPGAHFSRLLTAEAS
jgi:hypothetical protein